MPDVALERSYGCSYGCGNPYDYVFVSVADSTTELLCVPCFLKLASDILTAITTPDAADVMAAVADMGQIDQVSTNGTGPRRRGKNAPATTDDPDLIQAFDGVITVDELPEEFR